jgi:hypothetical protein
MEAIKDTVRQVLENIQSKKKQAGENNPETFFKKVLLRKEKPHIQFHYYRNGILGTRVDSSSWMYYFNLKKASLLSGLSKNLAGIKDIRFTIADISTSKK